MQTEILNQRLPEFILKNLPKGTARITTKRWTEGNPGLEYWPTIGQLLKEDNLRTELFRFHGIGRQAIHLICQKLSENGIEVPPDRPKEKKNSYKIRRLEKLTKRIPWLQSELKRCETEMAFLLAQP